MNIKDYLRAAAGDFVICLILAIALTYANCGAFYVSTALQSSIPALVAATALPLIVLFFAAYKRSTVFIGAAILVVGTIVACGVAAATSGAEQVFQDSEGNPVMFIFIAVACATLTFLLTRKRWLARVFVLVVILDICWVEFMYKQGYVYALIVALIAAGVMVVYRNYRNNLKDASTDKVSFGAASLVALVYAAVITGIACLLFFVVVAPLNPGAFEFKPFEKYMNYETVQMTGVGDVQLEDDPDNTTGELNEDKDDTNQQDEDEADPDRGNKTQMTPLEDTSIGDEPTDGGNESLLQQMYNFLAEDPVRGILLIILAIVVLVFVIFVLPFIIKKSLRKSRYNKMCAMPPNQAVEQFFLFFMKRLRLLKIVKPENATLAEFASTSAGQLAEFAQNEQGVTFAHLVAIYCASAYGNVPLDQEEVDYFKAFYSTFYKAFAAKSGKIKYFLRFFRV